MSAPHGRTDADALLPAEREMSAAQWAEYGGLPLGLRSYCHLLMKREADARLRERAAELDVAEWRERTARLLTRAEAAEAALAAARVAWHDAVENFHNIDRNGEATEICEWACALRDALADAEPDWGTAGGAR